MNGLDQLQPVEGMGPVGEVRLVPDPSTFRVLPYAPQCGRGLDRPRRPRRRAGARLPALVPEADGGPSRRARRSSCAPRSRTSSRSPPGRTGATSRSTPASASRRSPRRPRRTTRTSWRPRSRRRRSCSSSTTPSSATASRRSRPAIAPALQAADEQLLVARDDPRRGSQTRPRRVACTEAVAGQRGQRRARPLLALGGRAQPLPRRLGAGSALGRGALVHRRRARASAGALRARPHRASTRTTGSCRSTGPGAFVCWGHDNREAPVRVAVGVRGSEEASTNAELKACDASCNPYLALGRPDRRRSRRARARARAAGAGRGRPGDDRRGRARRAAGSSRLPATQAEALDALAADQLLIGSLRTRARRVVPRRPTFRVGGLLRGRRGIRATGPLREVLSAIPPRRPARARDPARAPDDASTSSAGSSPRAPTRASGPMSRPASRTGARSRCSRPTSNASPRSTACTSGGSRPTRPSTRRRSCARRARSWLFVDDGYPPPGTGTSWDELGELAGCEARPIMRIERVVEEDWATEAVAGEVTSARERGFVALKTIAAYRGGLDLDVAPPKSWRGRCSRRSRPTRRPAIRCRCKSTAASATRISTSRARIPAG